MKLLCRALAPVAGLALAAVGSTVGATSALAGPPTFLGSLRQVSQVASTVPGNGDLNPYGVAVVPSSEGRLVAGDTLVSNFNAKSNVQGTGTTIEEVAPTGTSQVFADLRGPADGGGGPDPVGLTTALGILPGGWVIVGNLPTAGGGTLPKGDPVGRLAVLNDDGGVAETIANKDIVGPWDLAIAANATSAHVFVSNALGGDTSTEHGVPLAGNCTVVRLTLALHATAPPSLTATTVVGKDFPWRANKTALVLAPTGLAVGRNGTLFVDDTFTNTISAIPHALTRSGVVTQSATTITSGGGLDAPLGMTVAPNGDLVVVNGNNGKAIEVTPEGRQVATKTLLRNGTGALFGLSTTVTGGNLLFVNDAKNSLDVDKS